jgi:hypothetical protein
MLLAYNSHIPHTTTCNGHQCLPTVKYLVEIWSPLVEISVVSTMVEKLVDCNVETTTPPIEITTVSISFDQKATTVEFWSNSGRNYCSFLCGRNLVEILIERSRFDQKETAVETMLVPVELLFRNDHPPAIRFRSAGDQVSTGC